MKRIISMFLVLLAVASCCAFSVGAIPAPVFYGDVNMDYYCNILDATYIQRALVQLETLDQMQNELADVDDDSEVTVHDATYIQRKVAGIVRGFPAGYTEYVYMFIDDLSADFDSGMAMVNEPVTFTVDPAGTCPPYKYDYYVNEVAVREEADSSSFEYTFEEAGIYTVKAVVTNRFGVSCDKEMEIEVVEPYSLDTPVICGVYYSGLSFGIFADECKDVKMTVNTVGGTQPYQYKFTFNNGTDKPVVQDFSNSNTFVFEGKLEIGEYTMLIEVKDELGQVTSRNVPVIVEEAKLA